MDDQTVPPGDVSGDRAAEVATRLAQLRELIARRGAGAVLVSTRRNFAWLTAGGQNHIVLATELGAVPVLVTPRDAVVLAPINEAARIADEEVAGLPFEVRSLPWEDTSAAHREAQRQGGGEALSDGDLEDELLALRSVLSPFDQQRLAWLGERVSTAMRDALAGTGSGDTEYRVAGDAVERLDADGIRTPVVLAAADGRIERYRHPLPTPTQVTRRLMVVLVGERWGLHAALTGWWEAEPPSGELARRVAATQGVLAAMSDATRPGATLGDVFTATQRAYADAGFPEEWRLHHQGGTIAYQGRERIATPGDTTQIVPGMAFAWNPSITGAKAEETFILGDDGAKRVIASF